MAAMLPLVGLTVASCTDGPSSLDVGNGVNLRLRPSAAIEDVTVGRRSIVGKAGGGFWFYEVLASESRPSHAGPLLTIQTPFTGSGNTLEAGDLRLYLNVTHAPGRPLLLEGQIENLDAARDRAIVLDYVLPLQCEGWTYESGLESAERIGDSSRHPLPARLLSFGDVDDRDLLRTSRLWFNCVSEDNVGLAIAVRPDVAPVPFQIGGDRRGMFIRFMLGLSPATAKHPNTARFGFMLYGIDGRWGIRSAARVFYDTLPDYFRRRATRFGNWRSLPDIAKDPPAHLGDFHIDYVEGDYQWWDGQFPPHHLAILKDHDFATFHWREPWSYFLTGSAEGNSADEELALLRRQAASPNDGKSHSQMCGAPLDACASAALNSYMTDASGRLLRVRWEYGCRFIAMNMDPELPRPNRAALAANWQYRWIGRWNQPSYHGPRNYAWDSCTPWTGTDLLNYRREQFATADHALTFDPRDGRICQMKVLADREFAEWHSRAVHEAGGLVMANMGKRAALYFGDCADMFVLERDAADRDEWGTKAEGEHAAGFEDMGLWRMLLNQRPLSYARKTSPAAIRRCLLYGLAPGSDLREEARPLMKRYMPALKAAARAGWQPITHAASESCRVERFGQVPGELYFTIMNRSSDRGAAAQLAIDCRALGLDARRIRAVELIAGRRINQRVDGRTLLLQFHIEADEALAFRLQ